MPSSNARLALMLPLYKEMDASLATPGHSPQASALVIATFTGATLFSPLLLTAKTSNLAAFTMMPAQVRLNFQGLAWLVGAAVVALGFVLVHFSVMRRAWQPGRQAPCPLIASRASWRPWAPCARRNGRRRWPSCFSSWVPPCPSGTSCSRPGSPAWCS